MSMIISFLSEKKPKNFLHRFKYKLKDFTERQHTGLNSFSYSAKKRELMQKVLSRIILKGYT